MLSMAWKTLAYFSKVYQTLLKCYSHVSGSVSSGMGLGQIHPNPVSCDHSENLGFDYRMKQLH